jgi:hypothetical protein
MSRRKGGDNKIRNPETFTTLLNIEYNIVILVLEK